MKRSILAAGLVLAFGAAACESTPDVTGLRAGSAANASGQAGVTGINIVLREPATPAILDQLAAYGTVADQIPEINAVRVIGSATNLPAIRALSFVADAGADAERKGSPIDPIQATDFAAGLSTWNQDAVNVTSRPGVNTRSIALDGAGVYVGVLDSGLLDSWRQYFPDERIAEEYGASFSGGGALSVGRAAFQPNKWEHDQNSHGTHVTSIILGYSLGGTPIGGVAPRVTVVPVKVLGQNGSGWSSVISQGLIHMANLKAGPLHDHPVVANMSLGGSRLDPIEKAAIDYATSKGVIVVAAAGNEGDAGMSYPGAYAPVISVAAAGWVGEWRAGADASTSNWWYADDLSEPSSAANFYIADWSSRAKAGQDLDVAAPGSWIVGPYQYTSAFTEYYFVGGTSQATPHVTGIVALMAQQNPALTAAAAEARLEGTAIALPAGCRTVIPLPGLAPASVCWGNDANGAGLVTADAALGLATPAGGKKK